MCKKIRHLHEVDPVHRSACREAWVAVGHPREPRVFLEAPIHAAETREAALEDARVGMMRFSTYRADLVQRPLSYEMVLREKVITGTPEMVSSGCSNCARRRLDGASAEVNRQPGQPWAGNEFVGLYCQEVGPQFK